MLHKKEEQQHQIVQEWPTFQTKWPVPSRAAVNSDGNKQVHNESNHLQVAVGL